MLSRVSPNNSCLMTSSCCFLCVWVLLLLKCMWVLERIFVVTSKISELQVNSASENIVGCWMLYCSRYASVFTTVLGYFYLSHATLKFLDSCLILWHLKDRLLQSLVEHQLNWFNDSARLTEVDLMSCRTLCLKTCIKSSLKYDVALSN